MIAATDTDIEKLLGTLLYERFVFGSDPEVDEVITSVLDESATPTMLNEVRTEAKRLHQLIQTTTADPALGRDLIAFNQSASSR